MASGLTNHSDPVQPKGISKCSPAIKDSDPPSHLLKLPPELRNWIYSYVLLETWEDIYVSRCQCSQPKLLQTCRQVREEASPIYYNRNDFTLEVHRLRVEPQPHHWIWTKVPRDVLLIENHGDFEFKDLMAWLKKCHEGYLNEYSFSWCEFDLFKEIVKDAFDVAVLLRNTPWKEAEQVLKRFARTLNSQSPYHLDTEAYWGDI